MIHVASPFPFAQPRKEDELIKPAVEGVTNVLKACAEAKTVKRVLMTSAGLAIVGKKKSFLCVILALTDLVSFIDHVIC